ncbi:MAG: YicC/YloC family endoribonuclease [Pseudomonadota bacterium]|nr:YicC/YloC family endoribonuclease [Pseudomonadota bacterium]
MTAFARISVESAEAELTWELRSVNHRYLEAFVRLPDELRAMEPLVRERVNARLGRGKLECVLRCRWVAQAASALELDQDRLKAVLDACRRVEKRSAEATSPGVIDLLRWPGVVRDPEPDTVPIQPQALELLDKALDELVATREREGEKIKQLLSVRLEGIEQQVEKARQRLPEVQARIREKLETRLAELEARVDTDRLEQELVFLAQKMDVDEELDRLETHVTEVRRVLERDEPVGRRLDFLMQEFNREANTLGSKSADSETTAVSVGLKVLIEQMREQVQNVE